MTPEEFLREYEQRTNTHRFEKVAPLIAEHAVYWFNDGSFQGLNAIQQAFEKTWTLIKNERYALEQMQWLVNEESVAVCIYLFHWKGKVEGQLMEGMGRGTSVLQKIAGQWKVTHEHLIPKYILGKPLDQLPVPAFIPAAMQRKIYGFILQLQVGKMTDYGLPEPDHEVLSAHPTISAEILNRITHGRIKVKPNIERLDGDGVVFTDGTRERIDSIIYCTGYKVTFPFFEPSVIEAKNNDLPLFHRVFSPQYRDLFFIGLLQPLGAIMPLAELQSIWVSKYLLGEYALPPTAEMVRDIHLERVKMRKRYGNSPRHTMQVDFEPYVMGVQQEMRRGVKRTATPLITKSDNPGEKLAQRR